MDWRVRRLASSSCIMIGGRWRSRRFEFPLDTSYYFRNQLPKIPQTATLCATNPSPPNPIVYEIKTKRLLHQSFSAWPLPLWAAAGSRLHA
jgi:hypothetical protein